MDTIFQKIIDGKVPSYKVYEDDRVLAFLDINPYSPGHTLVIPKNFSRNLKSISDEDLSYLILTARKIANRIIEKLNVDGYRIISNNEESSGQEVFHTHFHIIPSSNKKNLSLEEVHQLIK